MANGRNKLRRGDAGRDAGGFVALPWVVLDSPAYAQLSMHARALLLEVARQFTRDNNGWLLLSRAYMAGRGWNSNDMLTKAKRELLDAGFIFETVKGQRPNKAARYAVTWRALDRHPGYEAGTAEAFQRGAYRLKDPVQNASPVPPHGTERGPTVPPHGPIRGVFGALPVPPHGHLSREPSTASAAKDVQGVEGVQEARANSGWADSQKHEAAPRPDSLARRLKQQVRDEAVRGTVRTESTAQLELTLR